LYVNWSVVVFSPLRLVKLVVKLHQRPLLDAGDVRAADAELAGDFPLGPLVSASIQADVDDQDEVLQILAGVVGEVCAVRFK